MSLTLTIDALDWDDQSEQLIQALGGSTSAKPVKTAVRHAVTKTARWLRRQVSRIAAAELTIAQKAFDKARVRVRMEEGELWEALLWVGLDPFPAHHLGAVRWTRRMKGARAGRRLFSGAFAPKANGPIFRRTGKDRLPIEKEAVEFGAAVNENVRRLEAAALKRYRTLLAQELNFQLQKSLGNV